ncbi:RNA polymerase sigma factor [Corynebacterium choanae]|nr:RNA polymerase sigma factor [Corynebacterium choanae]
MTDKELIERAAAGDERAFTALIQAYRDIIWRICLAHIQDQHDAEDVFMAAITKVWANLHQFQGRSSFSTWVYRITSNCAIDHHRKFSKQREQSLDEAVFNDPLLQDRGSSTEARVEDLELANRALSLLSPASREAIILFEVAGLKVKEIAVHQGISVTACKQRLRRARLKMATVLDEIED